MPVSLTVFSQLFLPPSLPPAHELVSSLWTYIVLLGGTSTPTFLLNMAYQFVCAILQDLENEIRHLWRQNLSQSIASQSLITSASEFTAEEVLSVANNVFHRSQYLTTNA